jgi:hypothetical protein
MRPGITIAQSRQSPPPGGQSSNRNALQKHACRAEIVLFSTAGLGTVEIHAPDGQIQDHREKVASSRGHEPARHDNLIAHRLRSGRCSLLRSHRGSAGCGCPIGEVLLRAVGRTTVGAPQHPFCQPIPDEARGADRFKPTLLVGDQSSISSPRRSTAASATSAPMRMILALTRCPTTPSRGQNRFQPAPWRNSRPFRPEA